ncbi:MAG TPA: hypothetical protein VFL38_09220 [Humibacillus xanthopallidus]|nr:hypothetical protein [Humibacillus xanthopallidus]
MTDRPALEDELLALGRSILTEAPRDDLAGVVLARVTAREVGSAAASRSVTRVVRRRVGWVVAATVALALVLIPPVRAAVVELLRIGGIVVREEPAPTTTPTTRPGTSGPSTGTGSSTGPGTGSGAAVALQRAQQLIGSDIRLPALLGPPSTLVVTHEGRVVEITWDRPSGPIRLDVLVGSLSWGYLKTVWQQVTPVSVEGQEGVWLGATHLVEWVDRAGATHSEQPRLAGPTLVWAVPVAAGEITYRLEGSADLPSALALARSSR